MRELKDQKENMNELTIVLDTESKKPLYEQIYEYLKREMQEGTIMPGERLPSTRSLARFLQVSRSTVDLAYAQLLAEGYLESIPCKGYYAADAKLLYRIDASRDFGVNNYSDRDFGVRNTSLEHEDQLLQNVSEGEKKHKYHYDFTVNGIDPEGSPANLWRKISKRILLDDTGELFRQGDSNGEESLRAAIAGYLFQARGVRCKKEQIVVGAGNDYLLMLISNLVGRDTIIGMENPTYKSAFDTFKNLGHKMVRVGMDQEGMNVDSLEMSGAQIAYVMPSHQFPTGIVMPIRRRIKLLQWAAHAENRYIIEDDYDSEFRYKGKPIPALRGIDQMDKVIYIGTFSKSISPATRISYMVLPEKLMEKANEMGHFYSQTVSKVDQKIIEVLLTEGYFERHLNRMRALYKSKQEVLLESLNGMQDVFSISGEDAGLHIVLTFADGYREVALIEKAKEYGIRIYGKSEFLTDTHRQMEYSETFDEAEEVHSSEIGDDLFELDTATILLGFATMTPKQIRDAAAVLKSYVFSNSSDDNVI